MAEMVPQSGQKISSPPTSSEWCQRLMAPERFQVFHCNRLPPDTPGGKISPRIPNSSCRLNTPPRERKGKAKDWQTGNASLASPPTHLTGPPLRASSSEEECPTDGACSLHSKQTISESGEQKGNYFRFTN